MQFDMLNQSKQGDVRRFDLSELMRKTKHKKRKFKENPMVPKPKTNRIGSSVDWLKEKALERSNKEPQPEYYYQSKELKKKFKVLNSKDYSEVKEKFDMVNTYSQIIGEKAKMKDQEIKSNVDVSMKQIADLNELLMESIKSKVMLLQTIKD